MTHNQLTVVSIYGHNNGASAIPSIVHSVAQLPGSKGLLLSLERPAELPASIEWKKIGLTNYWDYSTFTFHCLASFIDTDYCLIVQDDGWVLNGANWHDYYYDYDYIGAPSHCGKVDDKLYLHFSWTEFPNAVPVQNGGFSLRSKRMLDAPNKYGIAHRWANEIHNWNEDAQLSAILKPDFEQLGMKYAPTEIAREFSVEHLGPIVHDGIDFTKVVGHHAQTRRLVAPYTIRITKPRSEVSTYYREMEFLNFLMDIGYQIEFFQPPVTSVRINAPSQKVPSRQR